MIVNSIFKLLFICLLFTSCFIKKQNELKIEKDEKLTFIFDFDATMYNTVSDNKITGQKNSSYVDVLYGNILQDKRYNEAKKWYSDNRKNASTPDKATQFIKQLHELYSVNISKREIDFVISWLDKVQTTGLKDVIMKLQSQGHKVLIIGGTTWGCAIIPEFAKQFGVEKGGIYSGYFKDFSKRSLETAFKFDTVNFEYVNCANPDVHTVYSKKKSDVIKFLKQQGIIKGKVVHIGDGENDLEVWKAKEADVFIGFGVNRYSKKVEDGSEIYVKTMEHFKSEIGKILNSKEIMHNSMFIFSTYGQFVHNTFVNRH